jgi:protein-S-isoprenylcysteine O-methyltransferase Ste14
MRRDSAPRCGAPPCNILMSEPVNPSVARHSETMTTIERGFLWLGGGLFVASLALAVYKFGVAWQTTAPLSSGHTVTALAVNTLLFTLFAVHHSLLSREPVKAWVTRVIPGRLLRSVYVWTASVLFAAALLGWQSIGQSIYQAPRWLAPLLHVVQALGLALIVSAARAIDALELAGIRPAAGDQLAIRGPYRLVRHPLYLGWLLIVWAVPLMTGDRLTFAVLSSAYLLLAMPWEEQSMARTLGLDYERYRTSVRWRLVPGLY